MKIKNKIFNLTITFYREKAMKMEMKYKMKDEVVRRNKVLNINSKKTKF
jgi:hypothetical protein